MFDVQIFLPSSKVLAGILALNNTSYFLHEMEEREAFLVRNRLFLFCKHMAKLELVLWFSGKGVT